jgi:hypothetical protein
MLLGESKDVCQRVGIDREVSIDVRESFANRKILPPLIVNGIRYRVLKNSRKEFHRCSVVRWAADVNG